MFGGERGIRTLDTDLSPYASLAGKCLRPLGQLSVFRAQEYILSGSWSIINQLSFKKHGVKIVSVHLLSNGGKKWHQFVKVT